MYRYQPEQTKKKMIIAAIFVLGAMFIFSLVNITGQLTSSDIETLEKELNITKSEKFECIDKLVKCSGDFSGCAGNLANEQAKTTKLESDIGQLESTIGKMQLTIGDLQKNLSELNATAGECLMNLIELETSLKSLVKNYALDVCCPRGIELAYFNISNNAVMCGSGYFINCSSGETDY